jgi:hypothetical protein
MLSTAPIYESKTRINLNKREFMMKRYYPLVAVLALVSLLFLGITLLRASEAKAEPPQQYPIMDKVADKIIQKYQTSACEQLWLKKSEKAPPTPEEQKERSADARRLHQQDRTAHRKQDVRLRHDSLIWFGKTKLVELFEEDHEYSMQVNWSDTFLSLVSSALSWF